MSKNRPYGLSYDGQPSLRSTGIKTRSMHKLEEDQLEDNNIYDEIDKIPTKRQADRFSEENSVQRFDHFIEDPEQSNSYKSYVEQFLNLHASSDDNFYGESDQEPCDFLTQDNINILRKASWKNLFFIGQKKIVCQCGKRYRSISYFRAHKQKYPQHKLIKDSRELKNQVESYEVDNNWPNRIMQAFLTLGLNNEEETNDLMSNLKFLTINLNLNIDSQKALFKFYEKNSCDRVKLCILWFGVVLKQFCTSHKDLKLLWKFQFKKFGLVANVYRDWIINRRKKSHFFEADYNTTQFLLEMFIIFIQWCHNYKYTTILIKRYGKNII